MKLTQSRLRTALVVGLLLTNAAFATNPLITNQFTADPTARVFEGKVYVYPSHDIRPPPDYKGRPNWFVMEDYHVFSSEDLNDWKDHGVILKRSDVEWADQNAYAMWAPDCVFKDGKYYFFFPAVARKEIGGGFRIGVATADKPEGPFKPLATPIEGVKGIDPGVFIDKDGSAYMTWSAMDKLFIAKLKPNMIEIEGAPQAIDNLPRKGLQEGPFEFERNGIYYLTYPHKENKTERLEYATSNSPMGPFKWAGVLLDESASGCWTVHQSIVDFQGQWYLFYHDKDLSPAFDKNRAIRADKLAFNADGTIQKVTPTLRGVGRMPATSEIQIDRYSAISPAGIAISFLDDANPFAGWKTTFSAEKSFVRFNEVDFGKGALKSIEIRAKASGKSALEIRMDKPDGPLLGRIKVGQGSEWKIERQSAKKKPGGVHDLYITQAGAAPIEVDWIRFR